jgi:hypothetical protein
MSHKKGRDRMRQLSITPNITVTIGRHTRIYYAFVTSAPVALDAPSTMTLYAATFADVVGFAADPITHGRARAKTPVRLVLVEATELAWQRTLPRQQPPVPDRRSRTGRVEHPPALAVATPASAHCQRGPGMNRSIDSSA